MAFAQESWQGAIEKFSSQLDLSRAEKDAHVQYMRWQLVQALEVLSNKGRAQVQASHHAAMEAIAEAQQLVNSFRHD